MTDRELLEAAARAAGIFLTPETMARVFPGFEWDDGDAPTFADGGLSGTVAWYDEDGAPGGTEKLLWNPLTDDGDALRLAVALRMDIASFTHGVRVNAKDGDNYHEDYGTDPAAATRRAIVMAAAAMAASEQDVNAKSTR